MEINNGMSIDFEMDLQYKYVCSTIDLAENMAKFRAVVKVTITRKYRDTQNAWKLFTLAAVGRYVNIMDCWFN